MIDPRLLVILACPRCHAALREVGGALACIKGHRYPVIDGIPIFLLEEHEQTQGVGLRTLEAVAPGAAHESLYLDTLGLDGYEIDELRRRFENRQPGAIDPAISFLIGGTCGHGYWSLMGNAITCPIPHIPVGLGDGRLLLDVGCNWGRWGLAALQQGWRAVGIDPSLGALLASRRQFGDELMLVCGDARFLPFRSGVFDQIFSFSVLQHFAAFNVELALAEARRVLIDGGSSLIQMAHRGGLRSTYNRTRRDYINTMTSRPFRVRYWRLSDLSREFSRSIGPSSIMPAAFGGLGLLWDDWRVVSTKAKALLIVSGTMKALARVLRPLTLIADSVFVVSTKIEHQG